MNQVGVAQLVLLPVLAGWAAVYCWVGRAKRRWRYDALVLGLAVLSWLVAVVLCVRYGATEGTMWMVISSTTAGFLSFNGVLALGAWLR